MPKKIVKTDKTNGSVAVGSSRPERLALNLFDLERVHPAVRAKLLPLLDLRKEAAVWVDKDHLDETASPFACSLLAAANACDLIRGMARQLREEVPRVYLDCRGKGTWERLTAAAVLTVVHDGKVILDPAMFPGVDGIEFARATPSRIII